MEEITGSVEHLTYCDEESHFTVAQLISSQKKPISIVGVLPAIQIGEIIRCTGEWKRHPKHGLQFEVSSYELELPKDAASIEKFLGSGAIRGIGPSFANKIVQLFGNHTLDVIDKWPDRLDEVKGLGEKRKEALIQSWKEHKTLQEVVIFLQGYGISRAYARKILRTYGSHALQKIRENPYQLAKDVHGIGFRLADEIAKHLGFTHDFPERIQAGIDYSLFEISQEGHVTFPLDLFIERTKNILEVDASAIKTALGHMLDKELVEIRKKPCGTLYVWAKTLFVCEQGIAVETMRLKKHPSGVRDVIIDKAIAWVEEKLHIHFAPEQQAAIQQVLQEKVSIITGGPGTGKSTITKALVGIFSKLTSKIILAAPTGRAAKRLTEITTMYASTIHRILKYDFLTNNFKYNRDNPIDADLIIIDESSMIDTYLMYQLLRAIHNKTRVVIIGDSNQLPSVGPGNVLKDLIASKQIPVTQLTAIFRQAKGSSIIVNAHRINEGKMPYTKNFDRSDFLFVEAKEPAVVTQTILELATKKIPERYGFDPKKDVQVLAPMRKGICGIDALNHELQNILTPPTEHAKPSFTHFRIGDKVMQLKNNYQKEVFNGDIGFVKWINEVEKELLVTVDERDVVYTIAELDDLVLAYAVSIHKYQGSECPCIVMPVHTTHFKMLTKNLLYTGVTRGKKLVIVVGTKQALAISVRNQDVEARYTGLTEAFI